MDRRRLLMGLTALAIAQVACQQNPDNTLRITALKDALPPQVLADFKRVLADAAKLRLKTAKSSVALFTQLQDWHASGQGNGGNPPRSGTAANWVGLSDYWLFAAIQQQLISPLGNVASLPGWADLPGGWRSLLQRNAEGFLDEDGALWATPYRWGHLMMVYARPRFERLGWQPTQWEDLWHPDLERRIALPNHPRLVLGLVLKALGYSANDLNPAAHGDIAQALTDLRPQVKVYASDDYLESLIMGDIWLAVGWSTEIQPILQRYRQLAAVVPAPGTLLTADVWVKPNLEAKTTEATLSELDQTWLSYWWQPEVLTPLTLFSQGLSPLLLNPPALSQSPNLSAATVLMPTPEQLTNSEFIYPLPETAIAAYQQLWQQLRGSK
jgi:putative spermidine/putrescine transport system substrate-binding protein